MARNAVALLLVAAVSSAVGHICLLNPVQRGGFDISTPGANACFQPQGPCGTNPVENPSATLIAGTSFNVLFQQNLNHYNPGWQGTMDISFGVGFNQSSDKDFTIVTVVPDFWAHLQGSQTNFTVVVPVPATPCPHCVMRVRYVPNKPTEPIFHQCSDIAIAAQPTSKLAGRLFAVRTPDLFENPPRAELVELNPTTGQSTHAGDMFGFYLSQGLVAADRARQQLYFIGDTLESLAGDVAANMIYSFDLSAGKFVSSNKVYRNSAGQWNALMATGQATNNLLVVEQIPGQQAYTFSYQVRYVSPNGTVSAPLGTATATDTFVNFMWADFDPVLGVAYVLGGDENALVYQDATLYTFDINKQTVSSSVLNGVNFTLVSLHVVPGSSTLYAFSPGQTPDSPVAQTNWSLVSVNPTSGVVSSIAEVFPWGSYAPYYGGSVYGRLENDSFLHVFRQAAGADDLALVNQQGSSMVLTGLNRGVNGAVKLNNYIYIAPK